MKNLIYLVDKWRRILYHNYAAIGWINEQKYLHET